MPTAKQFNNLCSIFKKMPSLQAISKIFDFLVALSFLRVFINFFINVILDFETPVSHR